MAQEENYQQEKELKSDTDIHLILALFTRPGEGTVTQSETFVGSLRRVPISI